MRHLTLHVSIAAFALSMASSSAHQPALRLRIQALSQDQFEARVTLTTSAAQGRARSSSAMVVATPAVLPIADSIQSIHIVVTAGGNVRATLTSSANPGKDLLMAEGHDLTLLRDAQGRFFRERTAQAPVP